MTSRVRASATGQGVAAFAAVLAIGLGIAAVGSTLFAVIPLALGQLFLDTTQADAQAVLLLAVPGTIAASGTQINIIVSQSLASFEVSAKSWL